jgi:hypothetical protein
VEGRGVLRLHGLSACVSALDHNPVAGKSTRDWVEEMAFQLRRIQRGGGGRR